MGDFIKGTDVASLTNVTELELLEPDDIEFRYVTQAEEAVAQAARLRLDTDAMPSHWSGRMTADPRLEAEFREAMKKAVFMTIERMAQNPSNFKTESAGGASARHDRDLVPAAAIVLLRKWKRSRRIGRG